ncbi:MAG: hypothetical protein ACYSR0_04280 [Planctomycetota bacterium]|jgi:hypothetical protein
MGSDNDFLNIYCHYPLTTAKEDYDASQKETYRVTTINWTYATNLETGKQDHNYVHKNVYEMSLEEFQSWCIGVCNEEVAEDIIGIERISE